MAAAKKARNVGVWIILILLFLGLLGFGATGLTGTRQTLATVGEIEVDATEYRDALQQRITQLSQVTGEPLSFAQAREFGLDRLVLSEVLGQAALDDAARRAGLSVGDAVVADQIMSAPAFRGAAGAFDREAYEFVLENRGTTEAEFEAGIRRDVARSIYAAAVGSGVAVPEAYADAVTTRLGETRDIEWIELTGDDLSGALPDPTEDELRAHHADNAERFQAPLTRRIDYAILTPAMAAEGLEVDETALAALYQSRIDSYVQPERRLVERLVLPTVEAADDALAQIAAGGATFDSLVADRGLSASDVDLGDVAQGDLGAAAPEVFAARAGDVVGPLPTDLGPALFRVNAVLSAQEATLEDVRAELVDELSVDRARRVIDDARGGIEDLLAGGATVADLAERTAMDAGSIDWTGARDDGVAAYAAFGPAADGLSEGEPPVLVELDDEGLLALSLAETIPARPLSFEEARDEVEADWRAERLSEALAALAAQEAEAAADGFDAARLSVRSETGLDRRGFLPGLPEGALERAFAMDAGEVAILDAPGRAVVLRVTAADLPDPNGPDMAPIRERVAEDARRALAEDVFEVFTTAVQEDAEVAIDQSVLTAVQTSLQ
ncbi:MAG: SurA N-terminal domain-containing protein [Paracoccaceae bacterium]